MTTKIIMIARPLTFEINYFEYDNEGREIGRILDHNKNGS